MDAPVKFDLRVFIFGPSLHVRPLMRIIFKCFFYDFIEFLKNVPIFTSMPNFPMAFSHDEWPTEVNEMLLATSHAAWLV